MDTEDYSTTYLKFLNDGPHSFLLHNPEVGLPDTFTTEPIFTEIEAPDWPTEGFPILLNSSCLLPEECNNDNGNGVTQDKDVHRTEFRSVPDSDVTNKTEMLSDRLFQSSDVLLRLNSQESEETNETVKTNGFALIEDTLNENENAYSMTLMNGIETTEETSQNSQVQENESCQVIEFLNLDGSVTTFNKDTLTTVQQVDQPVENADVEPIEVNLEAFATSVTARKCKVCSYLCESMDGIINHLKIKHADMFVNNGSVRTKEEHSFLAPKNMMSILNNSSPQQKQTVFLCCVCKNGYSDKDELRQHMIEAHKMQSIMSLSEDKAQEKIEDKTDKSKDKTNQNTKEISMKTKSSLLLKLQQRALKKVKCSITGCDLRFARDDLRLRHEECHINGQKKQFQCPVCKEKFSIWRICSMHLWKCHKIDLGLLTCPMCNEFKSNLAVRVLTHMMIHNEERPFLCNECGKGFKQLTQLKNHQVLHTKDSDDAPNWLNPKQCTICERYFSNSKSLRTHVKAVHDKFKPFVCSICGHKAARKSMIELHMRQHTGERPHQCEFCTYKSRDLSCLRKHIMTHVGSAKYQCPHCNYQSIQTSAYKNHLAKKHPGVSGGNYTCTYCSYSTVNETSYYTHVNWHKLSMEKSSTDNTKSSETEKAVSETNNDTSEKSTYLIKVGNLTLQVEDEDTQNSFSNYCPEEPVDMGGYTIPAGQESQLQPAGT